ncbi:MAG: AraC family transcriptional regulator, partial [Rhodospirillaceae bacterium]|nr:AraC family transcriptional regulator [Rhodospirillaceae bacterium]
MEFHIVASGECWVRRVGGGPTHLSAGDAVIFPRGDAHVMSSARDLDIAGVDF